jgi:hypothetical protein
VGAAKKMKGNFMVLFPPLHIYLLTIFCYLVIS